MPYGVAPQGAIDDYNDRNLERYSDDTKPIIQFEAREYNPANGDLARDGAQARSLTREQTLEACPKLVDVQSRLDRIDADVRNQFSGISPQDHGTKVHGLLAEEITGLNDPSLKAEISYIKSEEASYGKLGSIRIDVLDMTNSQTVCVYDLKTGRAGLSARRALEIAGEIYTAFGIVFPRLIITEVRPNR